MATYLELQTRVQSLVIDLPQAVQDYVPTYINEAIRAVQEEHNFKVMEALSGPHSTTIATRSLVAVPNNFKEFRLNREGQGPYFVDDLGQAGWLQTANDRSEALQIFTSEDEGEPRVILRGEPSDELGTSAFEIWPLPDGLSDITGGEYNIYIPYWKYLTPLSADGDQNWLTVNGEQYIVEDAAAAAFAQDWDLGQQAAHLKLAQLFKQRLIKHDKMLRLSTIDILTPKWQGAKTPRLRR